jgi:hypothetical protein
MNNAKSPNSSANPMMNNGTTGTSGGGMASSGGC